MEQNINLILLAIFVPRSVREILLHTYWWQVKEYRFDRLWVFLRTKEGKRIFTPPASWVKLFVLLSFPLALIAEGYSAFYVLILGFIFLFEDLVFAFEIFGRKIRKPVFTLRAKRIVVTSSVLIFGGLFLGYEAGLFINVFFWSVLLLALDKLAPFTVPAGIAWTQVSVNQTKKKEVNQARQRISKAENIISIGITGSYGKTSTKEFLANILSKKFNVAKTTGSENTEFGIARKIMRNVKNETEVFIAEMGAYKKGEIARLAKIVSPKIGIITGISPQHLELFGSLDNLIEAKYELIKLLPQDGIAIFNGDNNYCLKLAKRKRNQRTIIYRLGKPGTLINNVLWADKIKIGRELITFRAHWNGKEAIFKIKLLGKQSVENILGASACALALGMSLGEISSALKTIRPVLRTMEPIKSKSGFLVIDDSYSSNPNGFNVALDYLEAVKFRKIFVVTPGIIELGNETEKIHKKLGSRLAKIADLVILTSRDFVNDIKVGMGKEANSKLLVGKDSDNVYRLLVSEIKKDDVVLIEGRIPESLRQKLIE